MRGCGQSRDAARVRTLARVGLECQAETREQWFGATRYGEPREAAVDQFARRDCIPGFAGGKGQLEQGAREHPIVLERGGCRRELSVDRGAG